MSAPYKIWIAGFLDECGEYYSNATEAEGDHGGKSVEYTRADLIPTLPSADYVAAVSEWQLADASIHKPFLHPAERVKATDRLINARAALHALAVRPASLDTRVVDVLMVENIDAVDAACRKFKLKPEHFRAAVRAIIEGGQDRG